MSRRYLSLFILMALAVASWIWLSPSQQSDDDGSKPELTAGYYLIEAAMKETDESGITEFQLDAERIDHNPQDDSVTLRELRLVYENENQNNWLITATEGWLDGARERIILFGDVKMSEVPDEESDNDSSLKRITTSRVTMFIKEQTASSRQAVTIELAGGFLTADGLQADLKNQKIELLSNVRGNFVSQF